MDNWSSFIVRSQSNKKCNHFYFVGGRSISRSVVLRLLSNVIFHITWGLGTTGFTHIHTKGVGTGEARGRPPPIKSWKGANIFRLIQTIRHRIIQITLLLKTKRSPNLHSSLLEFLPSSKCSTQNLQILPIALFLDL